MNVWKAFAAGIILSAVFGAAGILAASKRDGYPVDGRVSSMTVEHLQRAISHLGLETRGFTFDTTQKHVLRVDVDDYVDGKLFASEQIGKHAMPIVGLQTFMLFCDSRDKERFAISEDFMSSTGPSEGATAHPKKPTGWGTWWNDNAVLRTGEKAPLFYIIDQGGKGITMPMPVEKMVSEFPRVIVVSATLEPEGK
jgi:hypothetical protein